MIKPLNATRNSPPATPPHKGTPWSFFVSLPKPVVVVLVVLLTFCIGAVDYLTGRKFDLSAFYLVPVCWAGWAAGRRVGTLMAVVGTGAWLASDLGSGRVYNHPLTPYWDALMLLVFFLVVTSLLAAFQTAQVHLEATVQHRTAALQAEIAERRRLESAKLQAERLAAVGTMAAQVAHEVRNPLGSITLNLDLLKSKQPWRESINEKIYFMSAPFHPTDNNCGAATLASARPHRQASFFCAAPRAKLVELVGDFNDWRPLPMERSVDGWWLAHVELTHGHHQYRFLVDGQPVLDPNATGVVRDEHGLKASLIAVS